MSAGCRACAAGPSRSTSIGVDGFHGMCRGRAGRFMPETNAHPLRSISNSVRMVAFQQIGQLLDLCGMFRLQQHLSAEVRGANASGRTIGLSAARPLPVFFT